MQIVRISTDGVVFELMTRKTISDHFDKMLWALFLVWTPKSLCGCLHSLNLTLFRKDIESVQTSKYLFSFKAHLRVRLCSCCVRFWATKFQLAIRFDPSPEQGLRDTEISFRMLMPTDWLVVVIDSDFNREVVGSNPAWGKYIKINFSEFLIF